MTTITMKEVAAFLLGEDSLDGYWFGERHPISPFWWREHLRAALPATAPEPAWHVAPTVPGLWVSDFSWMAQKLGRETVEFYAKNRSIPSRHWYGPIPEDKP